MIQNRKTLEIITKEPTSIDLLPIQKMPSKDHNGTDNTRPNDREDHIPPSLSTAEAAMFTICFIATLVWLYVMLRP